ncbi:MAG: Tol-Pal system beta propeller repeat protein TolB [Proteobacteria bacterium]|nr:Tol-Pal system beta propeller repeat protein TolB [Pseudomonadota bacterium]
MLRISKAITLMCIILFSASSHAILTIEITQGGDSGLPIAIVPFKWEGKGKPPHSVDSIVASDLARSGRFTVLDKKRFISKPQRDKDVVFKDWRMLKVEALVIGGVKRVAPDRYRVEYRLYDVFKKQQLAGFRYTVSGKMLRLAAHQISDVIYAKLMGEAGAFTTRIAYVTKKELRRGRPEYRLQIADSDGYGPITVVKSVEPLMSPAWSPNGKKIAYVSFEGKRSMVYVQHVASGRRERIAQYRGINSAPAWSPDGSKIALTLSKDGNAEIYIRDVATGHLQRVTRHGAIDTEPAWSPDGRYLIFTSDRAGGPQIYQMDLDRRELKRLTYEGNYNARASYSVDGKRITLVTRQRGRYHVAILNLGNLSLQVLTDSQLDESPSFAPNGRMIIYATGLRGKGVLASVSADGRVRQSFKFEQGDVREPAWSPYNQQLKYKE